MLAHYKNVIWDWNGTLMDDVWLCVDVMNGILRERGMREVSVEEYRERFCFPVRKYYDWLGFDATRHPFESVSHAFIAGYEARRFECGLHRGVTEALELLQGSGCRQYVLSAYHRDTLEEVLAHYGLRPHFAAVSGLDNIYANGKIELGMQLMEQAGLRPGETVLVGDTLHDHEVAVSLGVDCLLLAHGHNSRARLCRECEQTFDGLDEICF